MGGPGGQGRRGRRRVRPWPTSATTTSRSSWSPRTRGDGETRILRVEAEATATPDRRPPPRRSTTADADLGAIEADLKGASAAKVEAVRANLESVDGPFQEPVPQPLEDLQAADRRPAPRRCRTPSDKTKLVATSTADDAAQVSDARRPRADRARAGRPGRLRRAGQLTGSNVKDVTVDTVGPSWGKQISGKARTALIVFLIVISLYITLRFEFRMAMATLAALIHDLLIVIGLYAIFQFPVTPATVIALLTILGFSIYDGIVVFDRVDENTKLLGAQVEDDLLRDGEHVAQPGADAVAQHLDHRAAARSSPVLVLGSFVLGATTLEEFGLALFLGLLSGAYSSIFIATPLLAMLKEREPRYRELRRAAWPGRAAGRGARRAGRRHRRRPAPPRRRRRRPASPQAGQEALMGEATASTWSRFVRDIADFPKPGITFKDITPLLADAGALAAAVDALADAVRRPGDHQGGRHGGPRVHLRLAGRRASSGPGSCPVRKAGKLPWAGQAPEYELEYGTDLLEIHQDAVGPDDRVLIVDDVLATGGTAAATVAAARPARRLGGGPRRSSSSSAFLGGRRRARPTPPSPRSSRLLLTRPTVSGCGRP